MEFLLSLLLPEIGYFYIIPETSHIFARIYIYIINTWGDSIYLLCNLLSLPIAISRRSYFVSTDKTPSFS